MASLVASKTVICTSSWKSVWKRTLTPVRTVLWQRSFALVEAAQPDGRHVLVKISNDILRYLQSGRVTTFFTWQKGGCQQSGFQRYDELEHEGDPFLMYGEPLPSSRSCDPSYTPLPEAFEPWAIAYEQHDSVSGYGLTEDTGNSIEPWMYIHLGSADRCKDDTTPFPSGVTGHEERLDLQRHPTLLSRRLHAPQPTRQDEPTQELMFRHFEHELNRFCKKALCAEKVGVTDQESLQAEPWAVGVCNTSNTNSKQDPHAENFDFEPWHAHLVPKEVRTPFPPFVHRQSTQQGKTVHDYPFSSCLTPCIETCYSFMKSVCDPGCWHPKTPGFSLDGVTGEEKPKGSGALYMAGIRLWKTVFRFLEADAPSIAQSRRISPVDWKVGACILSDRYQQIGHLSDRHRISSSQHAHQSPSSRDSALSDLVRFIETCPSPSVFDLQGHGTPVLSATFAETQAVGFPTGPKVVRIHPCFHECMHNPNELNSQVLSTSYPYPIAFFSASAESWSTESLAGCTDLLKAVRDDLIPPCLTCTSSQDHSQLAVRCVPQYSRQYQTDSGDLHLNPDSRLSMLPWTMATGDITEQAARSFSSFAITNELCRSHSHSKILSEWSRMRPLRPFWKPVPPHRTSLSGAVPNDDHEFFLHPWAGRFGGRTLQFPHESSTDKLCRDLVQDAVSLIFDISWTTDVFSQSNQEGIMMKFPWTYSFQAPRRQTTFSGAVPICNRDPFHVAEDGPSCSWTLMSPSDLRVNPQWFVQNAQKLIRDHILTEDSFASIGDCFALMKPWQPGFVQGLQHPTTSSGAVPSYNHDGPRYTRDDKLSLVSFRKLVPQHRTTLSGAVPSDNHECFLHPWADRFGGRTLQFPHESNAHKLCRDHVQDAVSLIFDISWTSDVFSQSNQEGIMTKSPWTYSFQAPRRQTTFSGAVPICNHDPFHVAEDGPSWSWTLMSSSDLRVNPQWFAPNTQRLTRDHILTENSFASIGGHFALTKPWQSGLVQGLQHPTTSSGAVPSYNYDCPRHTRDDQSSLVFPQLLPGNVVALSRLCLVQGAVQPFIDMSFMKRASFRIMDKMNTKMQVKLLTMPKPRHHTTFSGAVPVYHRYTLRHASGQQMLQSDTDEARALCISMLQEEHFDKVRTDDGIWSMISTDDIRSQILEENFCPVLSGGTISWRSTRMVVLGPRPTIGDRLDFARTTEGWLASDELSFVLARIARGHEHTHFTPIAFYNPNQNDFAFETGRMHIPNREQRLSLFS